MRKLWIAVLGIAFMNVAYARDCGSPGQSEEDDGPCTLPTVTAIYEPDWDWENLSGGAGAGGGSDVEPDYNFCDMLRTENLSMGCSSGDGLGQRPWTAAAYEPGSALARLFEWLQSGVPTPRASNAMWTAISNYDRMLSGGWTRDTADFIFLSGVLEVCRIQAVETVYVGQFMGCAEVYNALVREAYPRPDLADQFEGAIARLTGTDPDLQASVSTPWPIVQLGVQFSSPGNSLNLFHNTVRHEAQCVKWAAKMRAAGCLY